MNLAKVFDLVERIKLSTQANSDLNSTERLDLYKKLSDLLKQNEKITSQDLVIFLVFELHKTTSKDVVRKLIIRCINSATRHFHDDLNLNKNAQVFLLEFLNSQSQLGQKLFILNVYLENLEKFGSNVINELKKECFNLLTNWSFNSIEELKTTTAPITISNLTQELQLLFKTLVIFLQRSFTQTDANTSLDSFNKLRSSIFDILNMKDVFNMEVGYAASMICILLTSLESETKLKKAIEDIFEQYVSISTKIKLKDLCFFQGLLTMLKPQQFLKDNMLDLFQKIIILILNSKTESTDVSHSIAVSRLVNFWTIKLIEIINVRDENLTQSLIENEHEWFTKLITFIWSHFEHNIDVVRNTSLQSYKLILQSAKYLKKDKADLFYKQQVEKCLALSWQSNSKLNALIILLDGGVTTSDLIALNSKIATELIDAVSERSTACLVADLYSRLFRGHRDEIVKSSSMSLDEWSLIWWSPILNSLATKDKSKKSYIYEYVLPRVIKLFPDGVSYCQKISSNYSTIISCTKVSRSIGLTPVCDFPKESNNNYLYGNIDSKILRESLINYDEQIRLDSLALICENPKTTEPILPVEFDLIKHFLYFNSDSPSPSYRQCVISSIKKLFFRLKESWTYQIKTKNKQKNHDFNLKDELGVLYKSFIDWLIKFIFDSIHLDSTFGKRNQNLLMLTTFIEIVGVKFPSEDNVEASNVIFDFINGLNRKCILSLVECLWDTYLNNKNLALQILFKINNETFQKFGFSNKSFFDMAIQLLSSRKPIDSMTSVYLVMFLQQKSTLNDLTTNPSDDTSLSLYLVESVVLEFEKHCDLAKKNLLLAALQLPVYGPLSAIRCIITQSVDEIRHSNLIQKWTNLINKLIDLCFEVSVVASSIVNSTSPEGLFPTELVTMQPDIVQSEYIKSVTPQMLLVCCWRTMKEISLFFGDLIKFLPLEHESSKGFILTSAQVFRIGDYFVRHLFETRHRGAFELAYVGFTSVCETFWKCKSSVYNEQPNKWLEHILNLIQLDEARYKLCSTRRGGGIPFYFQAIVSTELAENGRKSLDRSMKILLKLAEQTFDDDQLNFSKVLSMYVLSALFKDTRLGEDVLKHAECALIVAINGFDSVYWNVRNASTLLFSSLNNRIFGVSRSREEISKKNSMPGKMFFLKFPRLYEFFTQVINESIESINVNLNAKLYLVVLILCHLFTLSDEISDSEALLHNYIPLLLKCCKSPVMKTRVFIAKAISSIVCLDRYKSLINDIFDKYLHPEQYLTPTIDNNYFHGILHVISSLSDKNKIFQFITLEKFMANLAPLIELNHCPTNFMSLLNLLIKVHYNESKRIKLTESFYSTLEILNLKAIQSLVKEKNFDQPILHMPSTHDLLASIGETNYILVEMNKSRSRAEFELLISVSHEYSTNLSRGAVSYLRRNENLETIGQIIKQFKLRMLESVLKWDTIKNCLNLKTSCDLLSIILKLIKSNSTLSFDFFELDNSEWINLWKNLIKCGLKQTETETRVATLNLAKQLFSHILKISKLEDISMPDLIEYLESYLDRNDESISLSEFFFTNIDILKSSSSIFGGKQIQFWNILFQLLIDTDQDSNETIYNIIKHLKMSSSNSNEIYEYDSMAMNRLAIDLFIEFFFKDYQYDTGKFFLDQFELVFEFDSDNSNSEEELEIVFDRGVESVQNSSFYFLFDVCTRLNELLSVKNKDLEDYFNSKYKLILATVGNELDSAVELLTKMAYNDVKYAKISCCLRFLNLLSVHSDQVNKQNFSNLLTKLKKHQQTISCFIQMHSN